MHFLLFITAGLESDSTGCDCKYSKYNIVILTALPLIFFLALLSQRLTLSCFSWPSDDFVEQELNSLFDQIKRDFRQFFGTIQAGLGLDNLVSYEGVEFEMLKSG